MKYWKSKPWLIVELLLLFLGLPIFLAVMQWRSVLFGILWGAAVGCLLFLLWDRSFNRKQLWDWKGLAKYWRVIVLRWVVMSGVLALMLWLVIPPVPMESLPEFTTREDLRGSDPMQWSWFGFVRSSPLFYCMVCLVYPIASVIPQNIIYRVFFFHRYESVLGSGWVLILTNAAAFGMGHLMFGNWVAPVLTGLGGIMMAHTYRKTRSAAASWAEHSLYGDFVWTIGIGRLFLYMGK